MEFTDDPVIPYFNEKGGFAMNIEHIYVYPRKERVEFNNIKISDDPLIIINSLDLREVTKKEWKGKVLVYVEPKIYHKSLKNIIRFYVHKVTGIKGYIEYLDVSYSKHPPVDETLNDSINKQVVKNIIQTTDIYNKQEKIVFNQFLKENPQFFAYVLPVKIFKEPHIARDYFQLMKEVDKNYYGKMFKALVIKIHNLGKYDPLTVIRGFTYPSFVFPHFEEIEQYEDIIDDLKRYVSSRGIYYSSIFQHVGYIERYWRRFPPDIRKNLKSTINYLLKNGVGFWDNLAVPFSNFVRNRSMQLEFNYHIKIEHDHLREINKFWNLYLLFKKMGYKHSFEKAFKALILNNPDKELHMMILKGFFYPLKNEEKIIRTYDQIIEDLKFMDIDPHNYEEIVYYLKNRDNYEYR